MHVKTLVITTPEQLSTILPKIGKSLVASETCFQVVCINATLVGLTTLPLVWAGIETINEVAWVAGMGALENEDWG